MKKLLFAVLLILSSFSLFAKGKYSETDIGKIVLKNGKLVSVEDYVENYDKTSFNAVAVVYNVAEDGTFFWGMGIHIIYAPWAPKKSSGFLGIRELEGLKDGSKAFDIVKKADPEGYKNLKKNYPALYFAATYGQTYNVGKYKDGWYIPAYKETYQLDPFCYDHNRWEKLEKVMKALQIFAPDCSDDDWWCSDSECRENDYLGWLTDNKSGYRFSDVPGGIEIYQNRCTSTGEGRDTNYSNSEVKSVRVVRKFY